MSFYFNGGSYPWRSESFFLDRYGPERKIIDFLAPNRTADGSGMVRSILGVAVTHGGRKVFFWTGTDGKRVGLGFRFRYDPVTDQLRVVDY